MNKDLIDDRFGRFREIPLSLAKKGHSVQGLCLSYRHKRPGLFHDGPVCWQSINTTRLMLPGLIRFLNKAELYAMNSDVIWACSDSIYGMLGYMLAKKHHIPLLFDLYDNFEFFLMGRLPVFKHLYRQVVVNCAAVTCVSQPLEKLVSSYGRKKQTIILENAVKKDLFYPMEKEKCRKNLKLPLNAKLVGTAGGLTENRGIETLYDAFDILQKKIQDLHLVVAGRRNVKIPISSRIHDLGILPHEKIPVLLNALDVGIVCNKKNNFGNYCFPQKTREIMACNIPIIAASVGSMKELFKDHPKWLFEPGSAASLAKVLEKRITDQSTSYPPPPTWADLANKVEIIMSDLQKEQKPFPQK
jgi:teichuronic acid biosynthesis glycosyltransferase TuaC